MENIKYSIVIPAYNSEKTVKKTISTALNQTYDNIEVIVINDGSTDDTKKILDEIKDNRLVIINQENSGPSKARNNGIKKATGDFVLFVDSDDLLEKNIIKKVNSILLKNDYDVVLFKTIRIEGKKKIDTFFGYDDFLLSNYEKKILIDSIYNKFLKYNDLIGFDGPYGKVIKKDLILDNNICFYEDIYRFEDALFCKQLYEKSEKIFFVNAIGYAYYKQSNSLCNSYNEKICDIVYVALMHLFDEAEDKQLFYIKAITSLSACEEQYFLNSENKKIKKIIIKEFQYMINRPLYKKTLKEIKLSMVPIHYRVEVLLLRFGFIHFYLLLKNFYFKKKQLK